MTDVSATYEQSLYRRCVARKRNECHVCFSFALEHFESHLRRRAGTDAAEGQFAGLGACRVDQVGKLVIGRRAVDGDERRKVGEVADRRKIGQRIVFELAQMGQRDERV